MSVVEDDLRLTRPVWHALHADHQAYCERRGRAVGYASAFGQFRAADIYDAAALEDIASLSENEPQISLVEPEPIEPPDGWRARHVQIVQFTATRFPQKPSPLPVIPLGADHADQMLDLTDRTRPGPFRQRTHEFGGYVGAFEDGKLIAMGGTRMSIAPFTEISAVCTDPDYQGRGFGGALICLIGRALQERGRTPFLHANADNEIAKGLYRSLGFVETKTLWHSIWERKA